MSRIEVDTARLPLLLGELRLPAINRLWLGIAERSDREGWPATRLLATLAELEIAERAQRRIEHHLAEARRLEESATDVAAGDGGLEALQPKFACTPSMGIDPVDKTPAMSKCHMIVDRPQYSMNKPTESD